MTGRPLKHKSNLLSNLGKWAGVKKPKVAPEPDENDAAGKKIPEHKGPPPVWELAAQFFVHHSPEPFLEESVNEAPAVEADINMISLDATDPQTPPTSVNDRNFMPYVEDVEDEEDGDGICGGGGSIDEQAGDSNGGSLGGARGDKKDSQWKLPSVEAEHMAHEHISAILHPKINDGIGHKDPGLDLFL
ncbi:hypothetical protein DXG01_003960 [Tephrocybe rancida]|nr:hypothetical protein DXG01_003960 [Tephrocybe rancida]